MHIITSPRNRESHFLCTCKKKSLENTHYQVYFYISETRFQGVLCTFLYYITSYRKM